MVTLEDADQTPGWQRTGELRLAYLDFLRIHAPDYVEAWSEWTDKGLRLSELEPKTREFLILAIDAVTLYPPPYIDVHVHRAFNHGATVQELVDVAVTCGFIKGPHAINHLIKALERAMAERSQLGLPSPANRGSAAG